MTQQTLEVCQADVEDHTIYVVRAFFTQCLGRKVEAERICKRYGGIWDGSASTLRSGLADQADVSHAFTVQGDAYDAAQDLKRRGFRVVMHTHETKYI